MRVVAISASGEDMIEFDSLYEASKWAGLSGAADIKKMIDSGEEYKGVFFDWLNEKKGKSFSINKNKKSERAETDKNKEKEKAPSKWDDLEFRKRYQREWYSKNREKQIGYVKKYKQVHKEEIEIRKIKNAEKLKEQRNLWRKKNKDKIKEYNKKYYLKRQAEKKKVLT